MPFLMLLTAAEKEAVCQTKKKKLFSIVPTTFN